MRDCIGLCLIAATVGLAACNTTPASTTAMPAQGAAPVGMANPASVNCTRRGGKLSIVSTSAGQVGMCTLPSGRQCEEWALMRGECSPG